MYFIHSALQLLLELGVTGSEEINKPWKPFLKCLTFSRHYPVTAFLAIHLYCVLQRYCPICGGGDQTSSSLGKGWMCLVAIL